MSTQFKSLLVKAISAVLAQDEIQFRLTRQTRRREESLPSSARGIVNLPAPHRKTELSRRLDEACSRADTVFLTGRFRSGSTALWNVFRQVHGIRAYYEPFNERRFFDAKARGNEVDSSHRGVDDYWREYDGTSGLESLYDERWVHTNLHMGEHCYAPAMRRFIAEIIAQSKSRPVLQFNRIDFRLPWIKRQFSNAAIVHLYRNPREQWCSTLRRLDVFPKNAPPEQFVDHFYLKLWAVDLRHVFPLLDNCLTRDPYETFYLLWKLSWLYGSHYADFSLSYESLVSDPELQLNALFDTLDIRATNTVDIAAGIVAPAKIRQYDYAEESWYAEREERCEAELDQYFGKLVG